MNKLKNVYKLVGNQETNNSFWKEKLKIYKRKKLQNVEKTI